MEFAEELKSIQATVAQAASSLKEDVGKQIAELAARVSAIESKAIGDGDLRKEIGITKTLIEQLRAQIETPHKMDSPMEVKSYGHQIIESEQWKEFVDRSRRNLRTGVTIELKDFWKPKYEAKTTIDSSAVGSSTPGILVPQRIAYVPAAQVPLTIRDVLVQRSITGGNAVEWVKENAFTNAASPQTEASDKAESALTFTIDHIHFATIATWIPASKQVLDDWEGLARIINDKLVYGVKLKEQTEIISGDGLGSHLSGLTTQATAYAGTYAAASDTKLDTLRHALCELEVANESGNFFVLNPKDMHDVELIKTANGGANTGEYVVGDPITGGLIRGRTLWGCPVVVCNSMTAGKFLVGDRRMATVFDREGIQVDISTEHSDYFVKNLIAIRVEERVALGVFRGGAFRYGSF